MVAVAQLVRASDCGSEGCGIVPRQPPIFDVSRCSTMSYINTPTGQPVGVFLSSDVPKA